MTVVDATAAFECVRLGHEPTVHLQPSVFVESWICPCKRCGRVVGFKFEGQKVVAA